MKGKDKEKGKARPAVVAKDGEIEVEDADAQPKPATPVKKPKEKRDLLVSGFVKGKDAIDGKPAILDVPVGKGRVILFSFNPLHRYLNHADFRFAYNVILNWNDLPR